MCKRILIAALSCALLFAMPTVASSQAQQLSPTETVRQFYKSMREKKYKEAFALSIYKPAIDGLSAKELEELRPDFERMAAEIPDTMELSGETISGELATVFVKVKGDGKTEPEEKLAPIPLMKANGIWIIGDPQNQEIVKKGGSKYFFDARINAHHDDVQDMLNRITLAQLYYSQGHNGLFGNMAELIGVGAVPKDLETSASTGYIFHITRSADGKTWWASAEPALYGRSGKLSFYLDAAGVRSGDVGGKPLVIKN